MVFLLLSPTLVSFKGASAADLTVLEEVRGIVAREFYRTGDREAFAARLGTMPLRPAARRGGEPSAHDYGLDIARELARLHASHTGRFTPDSIDYFELMDIYRFSGIGREVAAIFPDGRVGYNGIGLVPREVDGRVFVAYVYDGTPAAAADIRPGDEILSVDGGRYAPVMSFLGKAGYQATVRLRRHRDGPVETRTVPVIAINPGETFAAAIRASARVIERDGKKIGYIRLWTFAGETVQTLVKDLLSTGILSQADALVLDLRCRWGGAPADAGEIFIGRTPAMTLVEADGTAIPVNVRWRKPVVALIDQGTRSGMEVLAYSLQKSGIPLVGARTAGALLGGRPFVLSDGSLLLLAVMAASVDGKQLEGVGVAPDIPVGQPLPYAAGRDDPLDRALDEARRRAG